MHARLIVRGEVSSASAGVSILADTISVVDGRLVAGTKTDRPASAGRRCRAATGAARPERKAQHMRMGNKGPHGRPWIWLMAVIVICLAPVMDPIAADITVTALAVWAMASSRR